MARLCFEVGEGVLSFPFFWRGDSLYDSRLYTGSTYLAPPFRLLLGITCTV